MRAIAFDTLEFVKTLREANFPPEQAEALAKAMSGMVEESLATKQDLKELEVALRRDLKELETALRRDLKELETALRRDLKELEVGFKRDLKELEVGFQRDLKEVEYRLTIRLGALLAGAVVLIATLVKLL